MSKRKISLQELHDILYEIIYVFDDYCKEYGIKYHLTGGSLLGAVRHNGIIPWDDDIDVMMERPEYERFQKLVMKTPPNGYEAYCIYNTKNYFEPILKFGKKGTLVIENVPWLPNDGLGINIDILPIDGCPNNLDDAIKFAKDSSTNNFYLTDLFLSDNTAALLSPKQFIQKTLFRLCPLARKHFFINLFNKNKKYPIRSTQYYGCVCWGLYGEGEVQECSDLDETIYLLFGKRELPVLKNYDHYLTGVYGDYMQLPPEEKRLAKHDSNAFVLE